MIHVAANEASAGQLFDWCREKLAYFKAPGWVLFMDSLPTTGTQKVQKTQIFPAGENPTLRSGVIDLRSRKRRQ
jgi:crotonobetaine/carnitine-CoA ligase